MSTCTRPAHTKPAHWEEWVSQSGIAPGMAALNLRSYEGQEVIELLAAKRLEQASSWGQQYATTGVRRTLERYEPASRGGWGVLSLDPEQGWAEGEYFRFKPDQPWIDRARNRPVKYEGPTKTEARPVFLRVTLRESQLLAERIKDSHEVAYLAFMNRFQNRESSIEDARFWNWVERFDLPICITEGEKKAGALLSQGIAAIAITGIRNAVRTRDTDGSKLFRPYLVPDLARFATKDREVTIAFDHEPRAKQRREMDFEIEKIKAHFGYKKAQCRVLELPGPEKGVDDFLVAHGADALLAAYDAAPSFEGWTVQRYSRLSWAADVSLDQRYLGELKLPESAKLVGIRSPKGTGKTESFRALVEMASAYGQRTLLVTHRVQLGQAICDRVYLPYVTELRTSAEGDLMGYGVCVDSLHGSSQARFNAEDWADALVIIDEAEQVIWHLLEGRTEIKHHRLEVLKQLQVLVKGIWESPRGRLILSDADLSDLSVRFVQALAGETQVKPYIIENHWKAAEPWEVLSYPQSRPDQWAAAMVAHIEDGGKPFIVTQSQKTKSRWSTTTLETLITERFPALKVLRIDSQSVADPTHPAYLCTANLNQILGGYDVVIASPTIETGVSIDLREHFTAVFGCCQGVLSENSTRQFLARVRDPIPRHLWLQRFGVGQVGNGATNVKSLLAAEYKLAKKHAQLVQYAAMGEEMLSAFGSMLGIWAAMACRVNAGRVHYRDTVLAALAVEGHHVEEAGKFNPVEKLNRQLDDIKTQQARAECEAIADAELLTESQYKKLKGQKAKKLEQWHQERHYEVADRYQVEVTPELVGKDTDGWYPKLRLYYYLLMGRQFTKDRDSKAFEAEASSGAAWLPTLNRSQIGLKVQCLEALGLTKLLNPAEVFNGGNKAAEEELDYRQHYDNCHPQLWELATMARKFSWDIKAVLGVTVSEKMSPIQIAQALLGKIGIKLDCIGQDSGFGGRQRLYKYRLPSDGRAEIIGQWIQLDQARQHQEQLHTPGNKEKYSQEVA